MDSPGNSNSMELLGESHPDNDYPRPFSDPLPTNNLSTRPNILGERDQNIDNNTSNSNFAIADSDDSGYDSMNMKDVFGYADSTNGSPNGSFNEENYANENQSPSSAYNFPSFGSTNSYNRLPAVVSKVNLSGPTKRPALIDQTSSKSSESTLFREGCSRPLVEPSHVAARRDVVSYEQTKPKKPSHLSVQITRREMLQDKPQSPNRFLNFIPKFNVHPPLYTPEELKSGIVMGTKIPYAQLSTPSPKKKAVLNHSVLLRSNRIAMAKKLAASKAEEEAQRKAEAQQQEAAQPSKNRPDTPLTRHRRKVSYNECTTSTPKNREDDEWQDEYEYPQDSEASRLTAFGAPQSDIYRVQDASYFSPQDAPLPVVLSSYLQLFFNLILVTMFVYLVYTVVSTIRHDVNLKVEEYSQDILNEISLCSNEYIRNNCMPGRRVPALEKICSNWEKCMNQDPAIVGRAKVSAETFAEIINSFIEPIGIKAMVFILTIFLGAGFANNVAFGVKYRQSMFATPSAPSPPRPPRHLRTPKYGYYTPRSAVRSKRRYPGTSPRRRLLDR